MVAVFGSIQMAVSRVINLQHHRIAQVRGKGPCGTLRGAGKLLGHQQSLGLCSSARLLAGTGMVLGGFSALARQLKPVVQCQL